jgi:hypothetical protein
MRFVLAGILATLTAAGLAAIRPALLSDEERTAAAAIRENRLRADTRFLASEALEESSSPARGELLARAYLAARFEAIGLEPGAPGGAWEQPFDIVGVTSAGPEVLRVSRGDAAVDLRSLADYVAVSGVQAEEARLDGAEVVFVGHGIAAPAPGDDFEGTELRGRVLLFLGDEPPADPLHPSGRDRSPCGRVEDAYESAARRGAAGAFVIHTDASAGCGWKEVQRSSAGEQLALPAVAGEPSARVKGWVTEEAARRLSRLGGHDLEALRAAARRRDFRPLPLGVRASVALKNVVSRRASANVIGLLRGHDPELGREAVLYTAQTVDAPSGVAALLAIAEAFAALPQRPRRSILFATVGPEGRDVLGSRHLPRGRLAAHFDIAGVNLRGRARDVPLVGPGRSTLDDWVLAIAETQGRVVLPEALSDREALALCDRLGFARQGVPSACLVPGPDVPGATPDEPGAEGDFSGALEDARLLFHLGAKVANAPLPPVWRPSDELGAARQRAVAVLGR